MYYELTAYPITIALLFFSAIALSLANIVKAVRNEQVYGPLAVAFLSVGLSLLALMSAEFLVHLVHSLREYRNTAPIAVASIVYLAAFTGLGVRAGVNLTTAVIFLALGAALLAFAGFWVVLGFGCATSAVCL
jgi:hypothetical protein